MDINELYHYGILGMKWGVRRSKNKISRIERKAKRKGWSEEQTNAAKIRTKKLSQMSNSEIRTLNERTRLENEYKNLNKRQKNAGEKFVSDVLRETAKNTVTSYTTKYAKKGVDYVIENIKK